MGDNPDRLPGRLGWPALAVILLFFAPAAASASGEAGACGDCHEEISASFGASQHGRAFQFGKEAGHDCRACHGPATQHSEEGALPTDVVNPAKAPAEAVTVFDLSGRVVRVLHDVSRSAAGYHDVRIDGRDSSGRRLASGVYFYRVEAAEGVETGRFVIAK